ncbi:MAG: dihydroorotate dehydrogenase [Magnetococcales bacterium]|nr:dihydroorotate dehydrogenase [Magnetococcales bacterium]
MTDPASPSNTPEAPSTQVDLRVDLAGVTLNNPTVLLSGCVGFGEDLARLEGFDFSSVGAICLKGTTLTPRRGNAPHRLAETPGGLLNAIGLQNPGARHVVEHILPRLEGIPTRLIANIAGSSVAEYGEVARIFDDSPVDAIEVNISCPNVKEGGAAFGADPGVAARVVSAVKKATGKPIITKLSPNVTSIQEIAWAVMDAGSDALSAINTLMGMAINIDSRRPVLGNNQGGLSGPAIQPVALLKVWEVYQTAATRGVPIIGQGGIASSRDAIAFLLAGSTAVGVGTALFKNPHAAGEIAQGIATHLSREGLTRVTELTGRLQTW